MVKTMRKVIQIGIAVTASVIAWGAVTVKANAVTLTLNGNSVKKIEDLKIGDKLYDGNSKYSNVFAYNYDYDTQVKNWNFNFKRKVEPPSEILIVVCPPGEEECGPSYSVPEPSSILASITATGLFLAMKRKMRSSRNA